MADIIQHRRDTPDNWNTVNPILADGERGLEISIDNGRRSIRQKIGDGITSWVDLDYLSTNGFPEYVPDTSYMENSDIRLLHEGNYLLFTRSSINTGKVIDPLTSIENNSGEWIQLGGSGGGLGKIIDPGVFKRPAI